MRDATRQRMWCYTAEPCGSTRLAQSAFGIKAVQEWRWVPLTVISYRRSVDANEPIAAFLEETGVGSTYRSSGRRRQWLMKFRFYWLMTTRL